MHWNLVNDSSTLNGIKATTRDSTMKAQNQVHDAITMDLELLMVLCAVVVAVVGGLAVLLMPYII